KTLARMALLSSRRGRRVEPARSSARREEATRHVARLRETGLTRLGMLEVSPLLECYGIPTAAARRALGPEDAASAAQILGFPVAIKICSPDIAHKTDVGGVRVGLRSPGEVIGATTEILARVRAERPSAAITGILVQRMAEPGHELLLGMVRDAQFGP